MTELEMRAELPYGMYVCSDREVLFNRNYQPIWERKGNIYRKTKHEEFICDVRKQVYFYSDVNAPWIDSKKIKICTDIVEAFQLGTDIMAICEQVREEDATKVVKWLYC